MPSKGPSWYRITTLVICAVALASPARGGDMATHLTATYMLARKAGFSDAEARVISSANWSMDLNVNTTALPVVDYGDPSDYASTFGRVGETVPIPRGSPKGQIAHTAVTLATMAVEHPARAETYHMLAGNPEEARASLAAMRDAAALAMEAARRTDDRKRELMAVGQYLHSLQDTYFHQHEGKPYGRNIGHLLGGHDTDKAATHFPAAVRAYGATMEVLQGVKAQGRLVSAPATSAIYRAPDAEGLSRAELEALRRDDAGTGVLSIASAIASGYNVTLTKVTVATGRTRGEPIREEERVVRTVGDPNPKVLQDKLKRFLADGELAPVEMLKDSRERFDYEAHPEWLVRQASQAAAPRPGGISLSLAAAARLSIELEFDSIRYADGKIVISGGSGGREALEAPLFLTALRLACERDDPYFSLDPVDGGAWTRQAGLAFDETWERIGERLQQDAEALLEGTSHRTAQLDGPEFVTVSVGRRYPELRKALGDKYPELRARLVFRPGWLRQTRFGDIMYRADVLLKELSTGAPVVTRGDAVPARRVPRYASANEREAGQRLLELVRTDAFKQSGEDGATGHRLWFDITPLAGPRRAAPEPFGDPSAYLRNLLDGSSLRASDFEGGAADELHRNLDARGMLTDTDGGAAPATLGYESGVLDLSAVLPRMYVRIHDHASGNDLPGSSPELDSLAEDVNRRVLDYARQYRELASLVQTFRAYVAAVKIAQQDRSVCESVAAIPLLRAERVSTPLPEFHPSDLSVTVAALGLREPDGRAVQVVSAGSISGGVTLGVKSVYAGAGLRAGAATRTTRQVLAGLERGALASPAWTSETDPGRRFAVIELDSREVIAQMAHLAAFRPIWAEDILSGKPVQGAAPPPGFVKTVKHYLALGFANRWIALPLCFVLVFAAFALAGMIIEWFKAHALGRKEGT